MTQLDITTKKITNNIEYIKIAGSLDATNYELLEEKITSYFKNSCFKLIIDMNDIHYISSAGAGIFLSYIDEAQENNGNMIILPSPAVQEVFDILGLVEIFSFAKTIEEAEQALS